MDSSGLQEILESIYAPIAVVYMLSGKAIARAVCAHFNVDAALNSLILRRVLNAPLPAILKHQRAKMITFQTLFHFHRTLFRGLLSPK